MVSACHSIARWLTQADRLVAILYASISPHRTPRFYGPTKPLFDKTWKLPDVEKLTAN